MCSVESCFLFCLDKHIRSVYTLSHMNILTCTFEFQLIFIVQFVLKFSSNLKAFWKEAGLKPSINKKKKVRVVNQFFAVYIGIMLELE